MCIYSSVSKHRSFSVLKIVANSKCRLSKAYFLKSHNNDYDDDPIFERH